jgi:hypothetical protein
LIVEKIASKAGQTILFDRVSGQCEQRCVSRSIHFANPSGLHGGGAADDLSSTQNSA